MRPTHTYSHWHKQMVLEVPLLPYVFTMNRSGVFVPLDTIERHDAVFVKYHHRLHKLVTVNRY